jgi:uncharacterized membrane protein (UPF0127 family)
MKLTRLFVLLLSVALIGGCQKPPMAETPAPDTSENELIPTKAQPKLRTMKIFLGAETLDTELALSPKEETTGMMFRTNILDTDSMLFVLPYPMQASFWMKNCPESISAAYITTDGVIAEIHHFEKNDVTPVLSAQDNIRFVLETSEGWFTRHNVSTGMVVQAESGTLSHTFLGK